MRDDPRDQEPGLGSRGRLAGPGLEPLVLRGWHLRFETRREILRAARQLFTEHGFAGTSVQQIAEEAGVAVQTIYSSVGSKSALVLALGDLIEEEADAPRDNAEIPQQTDPRQLIATGVHLTRQLNERCGDILEVLFSAAPADPDAAALAAEGMCLPAASRKA
jgi:AcrR family transcriptional regulator